jgi:hypothetical protein
MQHEETIPYLIWDLLITLSATLVALFIPLELVLGVYEHPALVYADGMITLLFFADIFLNFRRPLTIKRRVIRNPRVLARHYLKRWFIIDLLAAIPFSLLFEITPLLLLRLSKLARVMHLMHQWRQSKVHSLAIIRLVSFIFWLGLTAHWLACGWLALRGIPANATRSTSYLGALYWCVTTLTTVGYGDVTPSTPVEMVYTMLVMILGVAVYGYVIGNVANLLTNLDLAKAHYLANMERISTFLNYRHVPLTLQRRVYDYYAYLWENRLGYDESSVLAELPTSLRTEVSLVLKRDFIHKVPFFQGASQDLIRDIALELQPVIFIPRDYVCRAGEIGHQMYFISHGTVEVVSADGETIYATLTDGDFFGEIALLHSQPRTASIRALDYCDLYALNKETFERVLGHYPDFAKHVHEMAQKRRESRQ